MIILQLMFNVVQASSMCTLWELVHWEEGTSESEEHERR